MALVMQIVNLTSDSFWPSSRADAAQAARIVRSCPAPIVDLGAVSTRPGAHPVTLEEEWSRLAAALEMIGPDSGKTLSIDTSRAEIVRRAHPLVGQFIVNDVSGASDPDMLPTVRELSLGYVAMHSRGNPRTMDSLTDYGPEGVVAALHRYFEEFAVKADGIDWILDPGFGFSKTDAQCMDILRHLSEFRRYGRPILVGISHKRFTRGKSALLEEMAVRAGADIIRRH